MDFLSAKLKEGCTLPSCQVFYGSIDDRAGEIKTYYDEGDLGSYTIKVHALKSSARLIGAAPFADKAQALEDAGKRSDLSYIKENHDILMKELDLFKEPLSKVFENTAGESVKDNGSIPEADEQVMTGLLDEIRSAAAGMDCNILEEVFGKINDIHVPEKDKELIAKIKKAADVFDYDTIISLTERK